MSHKKHNDRKNFSRPIPTQHKFIRNYNTYNKNNVDTISLSENMTMEELLNLQDKIGVKQFSKKIQHDEVLSPQKDEAPSKVKRLNKNRPREFPMERKTAPRKKFIETKHKAFKQNHLRDPRFDDLSGKLNVVAWRHNYNFLSDMREKELKVLRKAIAKEKNPNKIFQYKKTIQRMENQKTESEKQEKIRQLKKEEREKAVAAMKEGKAPVYKSKRDHLLTLKLEHFEKLENDKKIDKYFERKQKKLNIRDKKLIYSKNKIMEKTIF